MRIISLTTAWLAGIWIGSISGIAEPFWFAVGVGILLIAVLVYRRLDHRYGWSLVHLTSFCLAAGFYVWALPTIDNSHISYYNGQQGVVLTGLVVDEPDVRDQSVLLRVAVENIITPGQQLQPVKGLTLVRIPRFPIVRYGTQVQLIGNLETPGGDSSFDYQNYLARQGIHSEMDWPKLTVLAENQGSMLYRAIYSFKARAQATIEKLLPDPQSALLVGILLGNDQGLSSQMADQFRITGMTHIIAISGFNIALLVGAMVSLGRPLLGQRRASFVALAAVFLYTILVGADAAVVRAAVMGALFIFSRRMMGRPTFAPASLFVAAWVMTLLDPFILWDIGFQLSFAATLGLMIYAEPFSRWTQARLLSLTGPETTKYLMGFLSEAVLVTLAAQLLTLPLIVGYFHQLSFVSLAANLFILPAQAGVMLWGAAAVLTGLVLPIVGQGLAWVAWLFLTYTIELVRFFAAVPGAAVSVQVSPGVVVAFYGLIFAVTWYVRQRPQKTSLSLERLQGAFPKWVTLSVGGMAAILLLFWGVSRPDGNLHIAFLDVGQGDAIFIQSPSGHQIVVDGGRYPSVLSQHLGREMPFWDREIDLVVATYPEADHINGLPEIFDHYHVDRLLTNGETTGSAVFAALGTAAASQGTSVLPVSAGEMISLGDGVQLEVLNPPGVLNPQVSSENSVAFRLIYKDFSVLLTGDAEMMAEQAMLQSGRTLRSTVLKAGYHGSNTSSTAAFLAAVQPQVIVISVGQDNAFGYPHPDMLQRAADIGAVVLRTDELGTIEVVTDGERMWWEANGGRLEIRN
ncbi:MAG: DNA internalization-related competence protein ComEC/Rec2 [Candidatus Promineifilaceae bacterium]